MKREITYYMRPWYPVTIIEDTEEGGYTVTLPDCPGCVTCCQNWEDIPATIEDAQKEWLEAVTENATPPTEEASEKDLDYYMDLSYNIDVISTMKTATPSEFGNSHGSPRLMRAWI